MPILGSYVPYHEPAPLMCAHIRADIHTSTNFTAGPLHHSAARRLLRLTPCTEWPSQVLFPALTDSAQRGLPFSLLLYILARQTAADAGWLMQNLK